MNIALTLYFITTKYGVSKLFVPFPFRYLAVPAVDEVHSLSLTLFLCFFINFIY